MIEIRNMTKIYRMGSSEFKALDNVNVDIRAGEYVAIVGPSGSGKSTLMNMLGCLDVPTSGEYRLNGQDVSKLNETQLAKVRNKNIGFVFQRYNLMGRSSALRNVELPARYGGLSARDRSQKAREALNAVGLADKINNKPTELSGGQQQRVAIARALVNKPNILLADEPTGALDSKTGETVMRMLRFLCRQQGKTIIVVTHDPNVASNADRMISLRDGNIIEDKLMRPPRRNIRPVAVNGWSAVEEAIVEEAEYVE